MAINGESETKNKMRRKEKNSNTLESDRLG